MTVTAVPLSVTVIAFVPTPAMVPPLKVTSRYWRA